MHQDIKPQDITARENDAQLKQDVIDELSWTPGVLQTHIGVAADAGVVTLTGHVGSFAEKFAAEAAVGRIKGVRAIAENLEVRLPSTIKRGDEEIAAAAVHRLSWEGAVPSDAVKVKVERGWITLSGEVERRFQKDAAQTALRGLAGIIGISDEITIKPHPDASHLSRDIMHALYRSWRDNKAITVTAEGGHVQLGGTVGSWADREMAEATAWDAPGATAVENNIMIL